MDTFKTLTASLLSLFSAIFLEYFLKFRPGLAEKFILKSDCQRTSGQLDKFVLKTDCQRTSDQLHTENRQDHQEIFRKLDAITKTQTLILQELGKKADRP